MQAVNIQKTQILKVEMKLHLKVKYNKFKLFKGLQIWIILIYIIYINT